MIGHILLIPDGHRSLAKKENLKITEVYTKSATNGITNAIKFFLIGKKTKELTMYILSRDNLLKRKKSEINAICKAEFKAYEQWMADEELKNRITIRFIGDKKLLTKEYLKYINLVEKTFSKRNYPICNLLVGYSGEWELDNAAKKFKKNIWNSLQLKEPIDLIIRTNNKKRFSNCPLLQSNYAELFFIKKPFPKINSSDFKKILTEYKTRTRKFGK